jgi:ABC-type dipeptide/oligopeptide/nickel transport system permease component
MLIAGLIGVPLGVVSATRRNTMLDNAARIVAMLGVSMPVFWVGLLLIILFSLEWRLLPAGGSMDQYGPVALVLPSIALGGSFAGLIMRLSRSAMLEVLGNDYIRTARAKGLSPVTVDYRHALRNALIPVVTVLGFQTGVLLSGAVLTETIFSLPGLGRLLTDAVAARDYPLVLGSVLVVALIFVVLNLLVDLLYVVLDPRIRYD